MQFKCSDQKNLISVVNKIRLRKKKFSSQKWHYNDYKKIARTEIPATNGGMKFFGSHKN